MNFMTLRMICYGRREAGFRHLLHHVAAGREHDAHRLDVARGEVGLGVGSLAFQLRAERSQFCLLYTSPSPRD